MTDVENNLVLAWQILRARKVPASERLPIIDRAAAIPLAGLNDNTDVNEKVREIMGESK